MAFKYVVGELMENEYQAQGFAYACNPEGVMNTQMAVAFRTRYPKLQAEYERLCAAEDPLKPGDTFAWQGWDGSWVFGLVVYENKFCKVASKKQVESCYTEMRRLADENNVERIAMPDVGAGIGGLNWSRSSRSLERAFHKWGGIVYVYMKQPNRPQRERS